MAGGNADRITQFQVSQSLCGTHRGSSNKDIESMIGYFFVFLIHTRISRTLWRDMIGHGCAAIMAVDGRAGS